MSIFWGINISYRVQLFWGICISKSYTPLVDKNILGCYILGVIKKERLIVAKNTSLDSRSDEQIIQDIVGRVMSIGELEGCKVGLLRIAYTKLGKKLKEIDSSYKSISSSDCNFT